MKEKHLKDANLIQGINVQNDRRSIRNAGKSGTITVSTIAAGRGTDIKLDKESIKAGGLHVIVSKLPVEGRTLVQNIGRSARQGQPGSATVYVRAGDRFGDISKMNPSTVNLFRLQERFSEYIRRHWPWMIAKKDIYTSESEYRFGASFEEILRTDAEIIVDKFFWPKKVLSKDEYQECLDLTKNMVLNAWGSMYTHLATSENGQDMEYCNKKYDELLEAIHQWISDDCPGPEEYIGCWAKKLHKDEEIFKFLYTHQEGMTVREFLKELFKYKRLQIHAMNADYDITDFDSMLKFMPEEHQKAYAALVSEENEYRRKLEKYNRDVAAYNEREEKRERIAKENNQVYTRTRVEEIQEVPEKSRAVEGPQQPIIYSDDEPEQKKGFFQKVMETVGNKIFMTAYAAGPANGQEITLPVFIEIPDDGYHHVYKIGLSLDNTKALAREVDSSRKNSTGTTSYDCIVPDFVSGKTKYKFEITVTMIPLSKQLRYREITEIIKQNPQEIPPSLPFPSKPVEPDWSKIGWNFIEGQNMDEVIWGRWMPPKACDYRSLFHPCRNPASLGCINDRELDRLDVEIKNSLFSHVCVASSLPRTSEPNSKETLYNPDGTPKQNRWYGPDGNPIRDRDYNHPGDVSFPHDHLWENGERQKDHLPPSPDYKIVTEENLEKVGETIIISGTVVGTGYLIYRGIRMLPSLFPALWWTIPANVATP